MGDGFLAGFIFGGFAVAFLAGAFFAAEGARLHAWLTTPSDDVQVHQDPDGVTVSVVRLHNMPGIVTVGGMVQL